MTKETDNQNHITDIGKMVPDHIPDAMLASTPKFGEEECTG